MQPTPMKIGAIAPWFGSKRTLAEEIVRQLGPHRCYWEPFCGSCAVLLAKPPAVYESVNDLHSDLINLARVLQHPQKSLQLYERAYRTLCCEEFAREAKRRLKKAELVLDEEGNLERAYWYLVYAWFHLNGVAGTPLRHTGTFCVRYSSKGGNGAVRWRSVAESIPAWHDRLLNVQILSRDAFALLAKMEDAAGTVVYVDPPYVKKGAKYQHDFTSEDHPRLAELLRRFTRTRVVLSYYEHPILDDLYVGWTKIDHTRLKVAKSMINAGMRDRSGRTEAPEILLLNGPEIPKEHHPIFDLCEQEFSVQEASA